MIKDIVLRISPYEASSKQLLEKAAAKVACLNIHEINDLRIIKRSIDARRKPVMLNLTVRIACGEDKVVSAVESPVRLLPLPSDAPTVIIVGAGPAGLFAAIEAIRKGIRPVVLERGRDVDSRRLDIAKISRLKKINPESNYCFGEGGAGAFSDGKLFTRSKKRGDNNLVLQLLVQFGASPDILIEAHPHIGSDRLPGVIRNIREEIIAKGGKVRFETLFTGIILDGSRIAGAKTSRGNIQGEALILATGHSAHDTIRSIAAQGVEMQSKGIAVGVRLEHPQKLIDRIQYHSEKGRGDALPAAEYNFVTQVDGRGVYSFCMCPGGVVVPAASSDHELVVNGMSASARSGKWANSGMVVEIRPGDFPEFADAGPLEMLEFQEYLERRMFDAAGGGIVAPAQRMQDFVNDKKSVSLPPSSYSPGLQNGDFNEILPPFVSNRLRKGFEDFGKKAKGFLTNEAVLIGLESRTSSPVRIIRDSETLQSITIRGLFPAGEGAGYAGGIVSAAVDGIRCADAAAKYLKNEHS